MFGVLVGESRSATTFLDEHARIQLSRLEVCPDRPLGDAAHVDDLGDRPVDGVKI